MVRESFPPPVVLLSGDAHPELTRAVGGELGLDVADGEVDTFADGESHVRVAADVRGAAVVIVQPTSPPVNDHLVSLGLLTDAATAGGAHRVLAVVPYFGYSRQERRTIPGEARSARLACGYLGLAGVDQLLTLDLHDPALTSAFPMPVAALDADELFLPVMRGWDPGGEAVIVAPDAGGMKRAQRYARALSCDLAAVEKYRAARDSPVPRRVLGEVEGRECILVDDLASTGRTLAGAARSLREAGSHTVDAVFTHPVLADGALERLRDAPLHRVATSDSIPVRRDLAEWAEVVPCAPVLVRALRHLLRTDASS